MEYEQVQARLLVRARLPGTDRDRPAEDCSATSGARNSTASRPTRSQASTSLSGGRRRRTTASAGSARPFSGRDRQVVAALRNLDARIEAAPKVRDGLHGMAGRQ